MYNTDDIPDLLITMAYGAENIDKVPVLGNKGAWVFRSLFKSEERQRIIRSLVDNHPPTQLYKEALEREIC